MSLANPGIASSTAHALLDGSAGYFNAVSGMVNLEVQCPESVRRELVVFG